MILFNKKKTSLKLERCRLNILERVSIKLKPLILVQRMNH